ncbi:MAG: hypothetical protein MI810_00510 [Flavobacteriales bacterium]|nr:hypothetical protein [Flavobacteriales bacterium]
MNIHILKTDIKTTEKVQRMAPIFDHHPTIVDWSVDTEDIDNVLRIQTEGGMKEKDLIQLIRSYGFYCETLPD